MFTEYIKRSKFKVSIGFIDFLNYDTKRYKLRPGKNQTILENFFLKEISE